MNNPPLEKIKIAAPCKAEWKWMYGDDRVRFCGQCSQNVYNLSAMTREQAEALIVRNEGRLCIRFYRRADGTILTKNCSVGLQAIKDKFTRTRTHVIAAILTLLAYLGILWRFSIPTKMQGQMVSASNLYPVMGDFVAPDPEPNMQMGRRAPIDVSPVVEKNERFIRDKAVFKVVPIFNSAIAAQEAVVRIMISPSGETLSATLIEGDATLKQVAEEAASQWKFKPMLVDGRPARVESRLTFNLKQ